MTEREAWKVAYQKWADADPCENDDAFVFRAAYAAAIRDAMARCNTFAVDERWLRLGAYAAWQCKDIIAALLPKEQ